MKGVVIGVASAWLVLLGIACIYFTVYCSRYARERARTERMRRTPSEAAEEREDFLIHAEWWEH